jgi:uncharacterized membrane-anchored protein
MSKTTIRLAGFALLAALQLGIPLSMLASRAAVLRDGTEIRLAVMPQDPRSIMRGDYSHLSYEIGRLTDVRMEGEIPECGPSDRESCMLTRVPVYVVLRLDENGTYRVQQIDRKAPSKGTLFIKGKVSAGTYTEKASAKCPQGQCFSGTIVYGIEDWFGPQGVPATVDRAARGSLTAIARVSQSGEAVLADLLLDGVPVVPVR